VLKGIINVHSRHQFLINAVKDAYLVIYDEVEEIFAEKRMTLFEVTIATPVDCLERE